MKRISHLVCGLAVLACSLPGLGQTAPSDEQVRELLNVMRAGELGVQIVDSMVASMKDTMPQIREDYWTEFVADVRPGELVDMLVPIYARHLSAEDVEEIIRFYRSPAGQRFLDSQPVIMTESMAVGQEWGRQIGARVLKRLEKEASRKN